MTATEKRSLSDRAVELGLDATVVREILATTATMPGAVACAGCPANTRESGTRSLGYGELADMKDRAEHSVLRVHVA